MMRRFVGFSLSTNNVIPRNAAKDKMMRRLVGVNSIHRSFSTGTTFTRDDKYFLTNVDFFASISDDNRYGWL